MALVDRMLDFQALPKKEQNEWCSHCGCTGGCNLCEDITKVVFVSWAARNKEGELCLYDEKPTKDAAEGTFVGVIEEHLSKDMLPSLTYENSPKKVKVKYNSKKKVVNVEEIL